MCDPISLGVGTAALMGGSVLFNSMGADQANAAHDSAIYRSNARQAGFEKASHTLFSDTLPMAGSTVQAQGTAAAAADHLATDKAMIDGSNKGTFVSPSTGEAKSGIARAVGAALDRGKFQAGLDSQVSGQQEQNQKTGIALDRAGQWQNIFGGNMTRNAQLL